MTSYLPIETCPVCGALRRDLLDGDGHVIAVQCPQCGDLARIDYQGAGQ